MNRLMTLLALTGAIVSTALASSPAFSQQVKKAAKIAVNPQEEHQTRRVFSGNEIQVTAMNNVKADCSGGPVPHVRFRTRPANGSVRTEELDYVISRAADNPRAHCNGRQVKALGVFYKSTDGFVGEDSIAVEVDFRVGVVRRYHYTIDVR